MDIGMGGPHRPEEPVDGAIGTGTVRAIDLMVAIVEAEADLEVHGGIGHRSLEGLPVEK